MGRDFAGRQLRTSEQRGPAVAKARRGKRTNCMVLVDGKGLPMGVRPESTCPSEVKLAEATVAEVRAARPRGRSMQKLKRIIADHGDDSDPLRERFKERGIELIALYRQNNKRRRHQAGRTLRRYKRRWIVERANVWLEQSRRLLVHHEQLLSIYYAFIYLACFWINLRRRF